MDAVEEARCGMGRRARRREITFTLAATESYLLEWVRDEMLCGDYNKLDHYFDPDNFIPVVRRWIKVTEQLRAETKLRRGLRQQLPYWADFKQLVEFRNALLHAGMSRPTKVGRLRASAPTITLSDLNQLQAGWAVGVVRDLIKEVHDAAGTPAPGWLDDTSSVQRR